jgi:hypothetical protein
MKATWKFALAAVTGVALVTLAQNVMANHDADVSDDELKCQIAVSGEGGKLVAAVSKCAAKCRAAAAKTPFPVADCQGNPPTNPDMAACVTAAVAKAQAGEAKKCSVDCPDCAEYQNGDCAADATARTATTLASTNAAGLLVYCDDSGSGDGLTSDEDKCQQTISKNLSKMVGALGKCSAKCIAAEHKGKIPNGSCGTSPTDLKTIDCVAKVVGKTGAGIDKKCTAIGAMPECSSQPDGAGWAMFVQGLLSAQYGNTYCGSPSGAFLD